MIYQISVMLLLAFIASSVNACPPTPSPPTHGQSTQRYGAYVGQVNTGPVTSVQRLPLRTRSRSGNTISSVAIGNSSTINIERTTGNQGNNDNQGNRD